MDMHDGPPPTCCKYTYWSLATITSAAVIAKFIIFMISNTDDPEKFRSISFLINFIIATIYESIRVLLPEFRLSFIRFWENGELVKPELIKK